jgi:drug/metabolite transporter (DMT)-like permease
MIPAACDFLASVFGYIAMNFIPGSVQQMLDGSSMLWTAIFSYLLLRKKVKRNQVSGCVLALIGLVIVGVSDLVINGNSSSASQTFVTDDLNKGTDWLCIEHGITDLQRLSLRLRTKAAGNLPHIATSDGWNRRLFWYVVLGALTLGDYIRTVPLSRCFMRVCANRPEIP